MCYINKYWLIEIRVCIFYLLFYMLLFCLLHQCYIITPLLSTLSPLLSAPGPGPDQGLTRAWPGPEQGLIRAWTGPEQGLNSAWPGPEQGMSRTLDQGLGCSLGMCRNFFYKHFSLALRKSYLLPQFSIVCPHSLLMDCMSVPLGLQNIYWS